MYVLTMLCILFVSLTMNTIEVFGNEERGVLSLKNESYENEMPCSPLKGVLSTGLLYEFAGEFDFMEHRIAHGFNWERAVGVTTIVVLPTEAAELGQFYLAPVLKDNPNESHVIITSGQTILVYCCPQSDNWVVKWRFTETEQLHRLMSATHIFSINRSTGVVVEYFDNGNSRPSSDNFLEQQGWQRTLGVSLPLNVESRTFWQRTAGSIVDFFQRFTR